MGQIMQVRRHNEEFDHDENHHGVYNAYFYVPILNNRYILPPQIEQRSLPERDVAIKYELAEDGRRIKLEPHSMAGFAQDTVPQAVAETPLDAPIDLSLPTDYVLFLSSKDKLNGDPDHGYGHLMRRDVLNKMAPNLGAAVKGKQNRLPAFRNRKSNMCPLLFKSRSTTTEALGIFLHWSMYQRLPGAVKDPEYVVHMAEVWIFARRWRIPRLQNAAMDALFISFRDRNNFIWEEYVEFIDILQREKDEKFEDWKLWMLARHAFGWNGGKKKLIDQNIRLPKEHMMLTVELLELAQYPERDFSSCPGKDYFLVQVVESRPKQPAMTLVLEEVDIDQLFL